MASITMEVIILLLTIPVDNAFIPVAERPSNIAVNPRLMAFRLWASFELLARKLMMLTPSINIAARLSINKLVALLCRFKSAKKASGLNKRSRVK